MIEILILLILWLLSCAVCALSGFFVGWKGLYRLKRKNAVQSEADPQIVRQAERELRELHNMLTYDGTPQETIDGNKVP